jgi:hypothetical protein
MDFKCIFSFHNWRYYRKEIYLKHDFYLPIRKIDTQFRICERCYKKQRQIVDKRRPYKEWTWVRSELSKNELRDRKIKNLLKKNDRK